MGFFGPDAGHSPASAHSKQTDHWVNAIEKLTNVLNQIYVSSVYLAVLVIMFPAPFTMSAEKERKP